MSDHHEAYCNFTVQAQRSCPTILSVAHALYFWRHQLQGNSRQFEIDGARQAMRELNEAFAAVDALYPPAEPIEAAPVPEIGAMSDVEDA